MGPNLNRNHMYAQKYRIEWQYGLEVRDVGSEIKEVLIGALSLVSPRVTAS